MKKKLITILSLILAFVLCFALVACGGGDKPNVPSKPNKPDDDDDDKKKPSDQDTPKPEDPSVPSISITLNQALDVIDDVLSVEGFTGSASFTTSTKNTEAVTNGVALDKRGSKLKITAGTDEHIVDMATGYVYRKGANGYTYDHVFNANVVDYVQYVIANVDDTVGAKDIKAVYDEDANTLTYVVEKAEDYNAYLAPLQNAYKNNKNVGALLNDYCKLLFGKSFDAMYKVFEDYISDSKNTVGTVLQALKDKGLDVEAILEMAGYGLPEDQMTAIKARPLNQVIAGAYKFLMGNLGDMMPVVEEDDDDYESVGGGMQSLAIELLNAMLFEEVTEDEITAAMQEIGVLVTLAKTFEVKTLVDMALEKTPEAADLYTVIKDGVTVKDATITVTLSIDDDKRVTGVKVDCLATHTYDGEADENSLFADNDYRATAEITIDEYKTETEDFVFDLNPACNYKMSVTALLYEVTDKDVSVYYETAGKEVTVGSYFLEVETPDGDLVEIENADEDALKFDAKTSSFVFDGALVKSALEDATFGTKLHAVVFFDDDYDGYAVTLQYVNADLEELYDYMRENVIAALEGIMGPSDDPNIGTENPVDGTYYYLTDEGILSEDSFFVVQDGALVLYIDGGEDMTEYAYIVFHSSGSNLEFTIEFPETEETLASTVVMFGEVCENYFNFISLAVYDENGLLADSSPVDIIWCKSDYVSALA